MSKVNVIYESTRGRTKTMAEAVCEGVTASGKECVLIEAKDYTDLDDACAIAMGSSTRMKRPLPKIKQILSKMTSLKGIRAAAFGSYGWSGEAPDEIADALQNVDALLIDGQPVKVKDYPNEEMLEKCRELGRTVDCNLDKARHGGLVLSAQKRHWVS